jgi:hypothetical protein
MSEPVAADALLAERARLGELAVLTIEEPSLVDAHGALGALLAGPARTAIHARLAKTSPADLVGQLRDARASRSFLETRAADRSVAAVVRRALGEYLDGLDAWSRTAHAEAWLADPLTIDARRVSAEDLALWAQDDNVGCQTGMLRRADGSVLLWHTEEDMFGYLDHPRLAEIVLGDESLFAFLYPYLLPGPAFGFCADQIHAIDSLVLRRELGRAAGAFTSVASFLVWRIGAAAPAGEVVRALAPYVDGCAIHVARPTAGGVLAEVHEIGGGWVQSRDLDRCAGAFCVQANAVLRPESPLARLEAFTAEERAPYDDRITRVTAALARRLGAAIEPGPEEVLALLADRDGGRYAFANHTVKGHCVARVSAEGLEIHVGSGAAHPGDVHAPRWSFVRRPSAEARWAS